MCIIVYKPKGAEVPSNQVLADCWAENPHGAGIMYHRNGKLCYRKGFMKFREFKKALTALKIQKDEIAAFHFRIATSGLVDAGNTHPFPVAHNVVHLRSEMGAGKALLMHNGVFGAGEELLSDTGIFVRDIVSPIMPAINSVGIEATLTRLLDVPSNRLLMFYVDKFGELRVIKTGTWNVKDNCYFSNYNYERWTSYNWLHGTTFKSGKSSKSNSSKKDRKGGQTYLFDNEPCANCGDTDTYHSDAEDVWTCRVCGCRFTSYEIVDFVDLVEEEKEDTWELCSNCDGSKDCHNCDVWKDSVEDYGRL